jgi:hypothetical protein
MERGFAIVMIAGRAIEDAGLSSCSFAVLLIDGILIQRHYCRVGKGPGMRERAIILHIGKTGGTAVRTPLRDLVKAKQLKGVKLPGHDYGIRDVIAEGADAKAVFFIRDPVSRFISGFNSRLRKGLPRHFKDWSKGETRAFAVFKTPNELAEALYSWWPLKRRAARKAMNAMRHTRWGYTYYLGSIGLLEREKDRILFIGAQESLDSDFEILKVVLELPADCTLPQDEVAAHRTPDGYEKRVSDRGRRNLERYYRQDYKIYNWCKAHRERLIEQYSQAPARNSEPANV